MGAFQVTTVDGIELSGAITRGESADLVIWMHGISVDKDEYLGFFRDGADWLARKGIGSLQFDFRGHGKSGGTSLDFSIVGQNLDVRAIMKWAEKELGTSGRLHLVAASFGAPPAVFAAARYPALVASVTLIAPVLSYVRTFLLPETAWAKALFSKEHLEELDRTGRLYFDETFCVGHRLVEEMRVIRPSAVLGEVAQQVVVLHGNRDSMVPYDATVQACQGLLQVRLLTLNGADHGFVQEGDDEGLSAESEANKERIYQVVEEQVRC